MYTVKRNKKRLVKTSALALLLALASSGSASAMDVEESGDFFELSPDSEIIETISTTCEVPNPEVTDEAEVSDQEISLDDSEELPYTDEAPTFADSEFVEQTEEPELYEEDYSATTEFIEAPMFEEMYW